MKSIIFTKHLEGKTPAEIIAIIHSIGLEGADLCVRPGYPVNPENAKAKLPEVVKLFHKEGLAIPLVTAPGDLSDPEHKDAANLYEACAKAGVQRIKIGYWHMDPEGYWPTVDRCRKKLEGFAKLSERYGVQTCVHNHSGSTMGLNSCSVMNLAQGFDPQQVGVFFDPGHLALVGEPLPMAVSIVKKYLSLVALKDLLRERSIQEGRRTWQTRTVPLGEGLVDIPLLFKLLKEIHFDGSLSFHCEYAGLPVETVVDQARMDVRFISKLKETL